MLGRSAHDREILRLALPAFGALGVGAPLGLLALVLDWGVVGVWIALNGLLVARLASLGVRFAGERWAVTGAAAAPA